MGNTKISEYSTTASSNTDINSVDLGEGTMQPSDVNNAIRELLKQLADMNAGTSSIQDTFTLADPSDDSKKVRIDAGGVTASNTRVLASPDADTTIAGLSVAQEFTATQNFNATTLTDASTIAWDASANQVTSVTIAASRTMAAPTNLKDGGVYILKVIQDGTGGYTMSWNAVFKFAGATAPTVTATANSVDIFAFLSDGTNLFEVGRSQNIATPS
mgnify:CR=1 FL=1